MVLPLQASREVSARRLDTHWVPSSGWTQLITATFVPHDDPFAWLKLGNKRLEEKMGRETGAASFCKVWLPPPSLVVSGFSLASICHLAGPSSQSLSTRSWECTNYALEYCRCTNGLLGWQVGWWQWPRARFSKRHIRKVGITGASMERGDLSRPRESTRCRRCWTPSHWSPGWNLGRIWEQPEATTATGSALLLLHAHLQLT